MSKGSEQARRSKSALLDGTSPLKGGARGTAIRLSPCERELKREGGTSAGFPQDDSAAEWRGLSDTGFSVDTPFSEEHDGHPDATLRLAVFLASKPVPTVRPHQPDICQGPILAAHISGTAPERT